jgi:hypothetical protein
LILAAALLLRGRGNAHRQLARRGAHCGFSESAGATRRIYGNRNDLVLCESLEQELEGRDALAICTECREFRSRDLNLIHNYLK